MSLDRAYVNCRRCYKLANEDLIEGKNPERDNDLYAARNAALQALQDHLYAFELHSKRMEQNLGNALQGAIVKKRAEACRKCNFSRPEIADKIEKESKE